MPASRAGTWLDPAVAEPCLEMRCFLLAAVAAGFIQKPGVLFARDGQGAIDEMTRLRRARAPLDLLGTSLILLYVAYKGPAQSIVGDIACGLARSGRCWDRTAVARLLSQVLDLPAGDRGGRRGRLAQQSGPFWLKRLLRRRNGCDSLLRVGRKVGGAFAGLRGCGPLQPAAGTATFVEICQAFQQPWCKLPGIGRYGRVAIARLAAACRFEFDGMLIEPCDDGWAEVRDMNKTTVAGLFRGCGVPNLDSARAMRNALAGVAATRSSRTAAKHRKIFLGDLALQACECYSLFAVGRQYTPRLRSQRAFARWCLERLPSKPKAFNALARSMRSRQGALQRAQPQAVVDHRSSRVVMKSRLESKPAPVMQSVWRALKQNALLPWSLPVVACRGCGIALGRPGMSRSVRCRSRLQDRRLWSDRKRRRIERATAK